MAAVLVRVERCGEHLDLGRPLSLVAILADLDFVATLVHVEQAPTGCVAFGIPRHDLDRILQGVTRLEWRGLGHRWWSNGSGRPGESVDKSSETSESVSRARATKRLRAFRTQTLPRSLLARETSKNISRADASTGSLTRKTSESISRVNASTGSVADFAYFVNRPRFIL